MAYLPTQSGFMNLEDSARLLCAIFPNYPTLIPCHPAPAPVPTVQSSTDRSK